MVSNVTSTGFHLAWAADLALHPAFQLTLTSTRSPTVHLETRDASLTLSGLEPGVLHLVEIVAKACETESARARLKVRTGKGFNAYHGLFLNGRKSRKKIVWWVKFKRAGCTCRHWVFHLLLRVGTPGSLRSILSWHTEAGQEGAHCRERCWADGGQRGSGAKCFRLCPEGLQTLTHLCPRGHTAGKGVCVLAHGASSIPSDCSHSQ